MKNKKKLELCTIIAKRLKSCREAAGLTLKEAALDSGIRIVQIQSFESGQKLPPIASISALCTVYGTSIDFVCGHTDDPIPEDDEMAAGAIQHSISEALAVCTEKMSKQFTAFTIRALIGKRRDRIEIMDFVESAKCVIEHFEKVKLLNPSFDDEIRAGANLENSIRQIKRLTAVVESRLEKESKSKIEIENLGPQKEMFETIKTRIEENYKKFLTGM